MRKLLLLIALLLIATAVRGQQSTLIQNVSGRSPNSPDGQWKVMVDPYDTGSSNNGMDSCATTYRQRLFSRRTLSLGTHG